MELLLGWWDKSSLEPLFTGSERCCIVQMCSQAYLVFSRELNKSDKVRNFRQWQIVYLFAIGKCRCGRNRWGRLVGRFKMDFLAQICEVHTIQNLAIIYAIQSPLQTHSLFWFQPSRKISDFSALSLSKKKKKIKKSSASVKRCDNRAKGFQWSWKATCAQCW